MRRRRKQSGFIKGTAAFVVSAMLIAQAVVLYGFSRTEVIPEHLPLARLTPVLGQWIQINERPVEKEIQDVLKADDLLERNYGSASSVYPANLFVAYFKSQRTGVA